MADAAPAAPPVNLEAPPERKLIAPLWHTILFVLIILGISWLSWYGTRRFGGAHSPQVSNAAQVVTYCATIVQEWLLFLYVYLGVRARGVTVRSLVSARWANSEAVWRDVVIAAIVWVLFIAIELIGGVLFRVLGSSAAKVASVILPHSAWELPVWAAVAASAGFCEEFIFRGYLQEQSKRLTGSVGAAIIIQAIFFGCGHGYQGWGSMLTIVLIGVMFGIVAMMRKSLAPTMLAHGWADFIAGAGGYALHVLHKI
jgi:uncharacterized protein